MRPLNELADRLPAIMTEALEGKGYESLTPVQEEVVKLDNHDQDLLVSAQTGSGKTVAFGLAMAPNLLKGAKRLKPVLRPLALIIAPTRELALQVNEELKWLYGTSGARTATCVGGMDIRSERRALKEGAHIVAGTPGRLRDHIERKALDTSNLRVVVLDEADEMLDMGFREDLEAILDSCPKERRTLLFSATMPKPILALAQRFQKDALRISTIKEREQHRDIEYQALKIHPKDREKAIINLLRFHESPSSIIFCSTRDSVKQLRNRLSSRGFDVEALSGELSQSERNQALQAMRDGRARVCVATDVAARGIDLPNLDLVVHADIPKNSETLLHRSGRTGRAGRKGICAIVVPVSKRRTAERLMKFAKIKPLWQPAPSVEEIEARDRERLLKDPLLSEEIGQELRPLSHELSERYSAENLARAFLLLRKQKQPAPEELTAVSDSFENKEKGQGREGKMADFEGGVWFRINTGRKHEADPRWLLPIVCKAGEITRKEVGAIHIQDRESFFEISPQNADLFWEATQENGTGEKSLSIHHIGDMPDIKPSGPKALRHGGPRGKGPNGGPRGRDGRNESKGGRGGYSRKGSAIGKGEKRGAKNFGKGPRNSRIASLGKKA